jgi:hypothetical protein
MQGRVEAAHAALRRALGPEPLEELLAVHGLAGAQERGEERPRLLPPEVRGPQPPAVRLDREAAHGPDPEALGRRRAGAHEACPPFGASLAERVATTPAVVAGMTPGSGRGGSRKGGERG